MPPAVHINVTTFRVSTPHVASTGRAMTNCCPVLHAPRLISDHRLETTGSAELTPVLRLAAGAGAGIVAMSATYPLDMVRGRLTVQEGRNVQYTGIVHAARSILREVGGVGGSVEERGWGKQGCDYCQLQREGARCAVYWHHARSMLREVRLAFASQLMLVILAWTS